MRKQPTIVALALAATIPSLAAAGVSGPAFYIDGEVYRTVATPTDLPRSAPDHSFDIIYNVRECQDMNVAEAAPGDPDFNGGRWQVHLVEFADCDVALAAHDANGSGTFDFAEEVEAAIAAGDAVDLGVVRSFVCTVNRLPGR